MKYTRGALRAGEAIRALERRLPDGSFVSPMEMAEIIDRETVAPALLEALEECNEQLLHNADYHCTSGKCARCIVAEKVETAIWLAKGGS